MTIYEKINSASSEREVKEALRPLKMKELKEVANHYHVFVFQSNKTNYINRIADATAGARVRSEIIKGVEF